VLLTVSEYAGLVEDTITRGYRSTNSVMMQLAIVIVVAVKPQPWWSPVTASMAPTAAMQAISSIRLRKAPPCASTCVHPMNASTSSAVTGDTLLAIRQARALSSSVVFIAMKVPPCMTQIATSVIPVTMAYGWKRPQNVPVYSWLELIGRPCSRSPSAMPMTNGTIRLATDSSALHVRRQRSRGLLPRYSNDTPRTMSAPSRMTMAR
jgi:hypothetical protein